MLRPLELAEVAVVEQMRSAERAPSVFLAPQPHHALITCVVHVIDTQRHKLSAFATADHTLSAGLLSAGLHRSHKVCAIK